MNPLSTHEMEKGGGGGGGVVVFLVFWFFVVGEGRTPGERVMIETVRVEPQSETLRAMGRKGRGDPSTMSTLEEEGSDTPH